jgi:hypothetical protein
MNYLDAQRNKVFPSLTAYCGRGNTTDMHVPDAKDCVLLARPDVHRAHER